MQAGPLHARCMYSVPENLLNGCLEATLSPGSGTSSRTIWVFQLSRIRMWLSVDRFGTEARRVSWDGFIAYDGVPYGLPGEPPVAGSVVLVRERHHELLVFSGGQRIATLTKRPQSQDIIYHPDQFRTVAPASAIKAEAKPLRHLVPEPDVARRPLSEYDHLFGQERRWTAMMAFGISYSGVPKD